MEVHVLGNRRMIRESMAEQWGVYLRQCVVRRGVNRAI